MGLVPLEKMPPRALLPFLPCEDTAGRRQSVNQEAGSQQTLNLPMP